MVGVQLEKPANNHEGYAMMTEALQKLQTHFGNACEIVKNDRSSIRLKLRWDGSLFTITLTPNTGYIWVQGQAAKVLPLAQHIQEFVGGVVYSAKQPGAAPCNPAEDSQSEPEFTHGPSAFHGPTDEATVHGAEDEATVHGATLAAGASRSSGGVASSPVTGNDNIQVGTVIINAQTQDNEENTAQQMVA